MAKKILVIVEGAKGSGASGNFGHRGRAGKIGGSIGRGGTVGASGIITDPKEAFKLANANLFSTMGMHGAQKNEEIEHQIAALQDLKTKVNLPENLMHPEGGTQQNAFNTYVDKQISNYQAYLKFNKAKTPQTPVPQMKPAIAPKPALAPAKVELPKADTTKSSSLPSHVAAAMDHGRDNSERSFLGVEALLGQGKVPGKINKRTPAAQVDAIVKVMSSLDTSAKTSKADIIKLWNVWSMEN